MNVVEILAPGFEEIEALTPVDYLRRGGVNVTIAGINAIDQQCTKVIEGAHGIKVESDMSFDEYLTSLDGQLPDAIVIPGGMPGALNIGKNEKVIDFINRMNEAKKLICAICASPIVVLAQTGILKGKNFICYPGMDQKIADFVSDTSKIPELLEDSYLCHTKPYVIDGNLITGKGPGAAEEFSMAILKTLVSVDTMMQVKTSSCQR